MKRHLLCFLAGAGLVATQAQNTCSTALLITPGSHIVGAIDGSEVPQPDCLGDWGDPTGAEWYRFSSATDTAVIISTVTIGADTRFHVYTGSCGSLTCVAGDDDSGAGNMAVDTFNVEAGVMYRLAFDDSWSANGFTFAFALTDQLVDPVTPIEPVDFTQQGFTAMQGWIYGAVDMNGDHLDDAVAPGTTNVHIQHQLDGGGFAPVNIATSAADHSASWSMSAGDLDGNGYNDLQYGDSDGVTYMLANSTGTGFTELSFPQSVFSQRGNMVDINNDGALDAFMCHDIDANVYYLNDGDGNFTYHQGDFGSTCGNYGSIWVDYDGDGDQDLFVAKCGCDPIDILMRNNGDGSFTHMAAALGFADIHESWSGAWGDFDNDGDMDVLIGTSSYWGPSPIGHKLMRNNGDGTFTNATAGSGFDTWPGNSEEWTTHDFNNDGYLDVLGGQALHYGNGDLTFWADNSAPMNGPIGDLNNDGFLDILTGSGVHMNDANANNWITVALTGTVSNTNGIGARIHVLTALGPQIREIRSGDGFGYMSSLNAHFGLGGDTEIGQVEVHWPSGTVDVVHGPSINGTLHIVEGSFPTAVVERHTTELMLFPIPAENMLTVSGKDLPSSAPVTITDATGKQVMRTTLDNGQLDVSSLGSGAYVLNVAVKGSVVSRKFTKK